MRSSIDTLFRRALHSGCQSTASACPASCNVLCRWSLFWDLEPYKLDSVSIVPIRPTLFSRWLPAPILQTMQWISGPIGGGRTGQARQSSVEGPVNQAKSESGKLDVSVRRPAASGAPQSAIEKAMAARWMEPSARPVKAEMARIGLSRI